MIFAYTWSDFLYGFYFVMGGCITPLIVSTMTLMLICIICIIAHPMGQGMYPTLIIIICALDQSFHERTQISAQASLPLSGLAFAPPHRGQSISDVSQMVPAPRSPLPAPECTA